MSRGRRQRKASRELELPQVNHPMLRFEDEEELERFARFWKKKFVDTCYIDWGVLQRVGLEAQVRELINFGSWNRLFKIKEPVYRELTLEFLTTFKVEKENITWGVENEIVFRVNQQVYKMTMTRFSMLMGLYDEQYSRTIEFKQLPVTWPPGVDERAYWSQISNSPMYDPAKSKASTLREQAHRYVHWLLTHTLAGRGDSNGVVGNYDLFYLHSIIERRPVHLGVILAFFIYRQAHDKRIGNISVGPYITRLVKGLGLFDNVRDMCYQECQMKPIKLTSLRMMGMVPRDPRQDDDGDEEIDENEEERLPSIQPVRPANVRNDRASSFRASLSDSARLDRLERQTRRILRRQDRLLRQQNRHFIRVDQYLKLFAAHLNLNPLPLLSEEEIETETEDD